MCCRHRRLLNSLNHYSRCGTMMTALLLLPTLAGVRCDDVVVVGSAGPTFGGEQVRCVTSPVGGTAVLSCTVLHIGDRGVSWVRTRDVQIMSHRGFVFTADRRVSASDNGNSHELRIARLRHTDTGQYECQINTEPKMSLIYNLTVVDEVMPRVSVSAAGAGDVVRAAEGGAATLECEARYVPAPVALSPPPLDVRWLRGGAPLTLSSSRTSALDTSRTSARTVSRLTLAALTAADAGEYICTSGQHNITIYLIVTTREPGAEAMQRDESAEASGAGTSGAGTSGALAAAAAALSAIVGAALVR